MVISIVAFRQVWVSNSVTPPVEAVGSLEIQMIQCARHQHNGSKSRSKPTTQGASSSLGNSSTRQVASTKSEAIKVPRLSSNTLIETFMHKVEVAEVPLNMVKLYHPRTEGDRVVVIGLTRSLTMSRAPFTLFCPSAEVSHVRYNLEHQSYEPFNVSH